MAAQVTGLLCRALIREYEGFSPTVYTCPAGYPTIGYGHVVLPGERFDKPMTVAEAERLLTKDLASRERDVLTLVKVPMTQGQFDALVSFVYNIGAYGTPKSPRLRESTLLAMFNAGNAAGAAAQFSRWNESAGKVQAGLVRRRAAEAELFRLSDAQYAERAQLEGATK
jgi:lysozyme